MNRIGNGTETVGADRPKRFGWSFAVICFFLGALVESLGWYVFHNLGGAAAARQGWYYYAGLFLLLSFLPSTVISYRGIRLPKKKEEYDRIMKRLEEAEIEDSKTFTIVDEAYSRWDYLLPLAFVTLFSLMAFCLLFKDGATILLTGVEICRSGGSGASEDRSLVAMLMAFLGAYIWSIQYIFRRLVSIDLPPGAYYSVGIRMVMSSFVSLIFCYFIWALPEGKISIGNTSMDFIPDQSMKGMLPVIAFLIGFFPQRALVYMAERFKFSETKSKAAAPKLPLELLEGITAYHKERFSELSIDNIQNLVKSSLVELILKTPFKPRQLIDWMLQGRLWLQFKDDAVKLRSAGVRTILGFKIIGDLGKLAMLEAKTELSAEHLETVYAIIKDSPAIERLSKAKDCLHSI